MFKCLIALTSLFSAVAIAAPVWTWVDEQGRRHYSDRPVEGATQIEVSGTQTFSGAALRAGSTPQPAQTRATAAGGEDAQAQSYSVLDLVSPSDGESFWNIGGELTVQVATNPALRAGHQIDVIFDGSRRTIGARSLDFTLGEVWRGEHTLAAIIVDSAGNELMRSDPVMFFVHQTSIVNPR